MPVYRAIIKMRDSELLGNNDFSFNAHVNEGSTASAWSAAEGIAAALLETILPATITVVSIGVSNPDVVNGTLIIPQSSTGTRVVTGDALPGWNVAVMQLTPNLGERLHTFYLRSGMTEDDVAGQVIGTTLHSLLNDAKNGILAVGSVCDKDGAIFNYGEVSTLVHMRQLGWRRRTRPGYKRGWVPV